MVRKSAQLFKITLNRQKVEFLMLLPFFFSCRQAVQIGGDRSHKIIEITNNNIEGELGVA
jgi:hypothetical protein